MCGERIITRCDRLTREPVINSTRIGGGGNSNVLYNIPPFHGVLLVVIVCYDTDTRFRHGFDFTVSDRPPAIAVRTRVRTTNKYR